MVFKIEPFAKNDIQLEINYYNEKQEGLGKKFHTEIKTSFNAIRQNPFYQIRYDNVRCLPLKKFHAMIHYTVDEVKNRIIVRAVINTNRNPKTSWI